MNDGPVIGAKVAMTFGFAEDRWEMRLTDTGDFWISKGKNHPTYGEFNKTTPTESVGRMTPEDFEDGMRAYRAMKACMGETKGIIRAREDKEREDAQYVHASLETTRLQEEAYKAAGAVGAKLVYPGHAIGGNYRKNSIEADMPLRAEPGQENEFVEIPTPIDSRDIPHFRAGLRLADAIKDYIDSAITNRVMP